MIGLLLAAILTVMAITGISMLVAPHNYAGQRLVPALRRPLACQLTGLALILAAIAGAVASFIQFALSNYAE